MNKLIKYILILSALIPCVTYADEAKWYYIGNDDKVIADLRLEPKQKRVFIIKSSESKEIMFQTEIKQDDSEKRKKGPFPIEMKQIETNKSIRTFYGGLMCDPVKGVITLELTNVSDKQYKVVVFEAIGWKHLEDIPHGKD